MTRTRIIAARLTQAELDEVDRVARLANLSRSNTTQMLLTKGLLAWWTEQASPKKQRV